MTLTLENAFEWKVSTRNYTMEQSEQIWQTAMGNLYLTVNHHYSTTLDGEILFKKSPAGMSIASITGTPQTIIGTPPGQIDNLWLAIVLQGDTSLHINNKNVQFDNNCILYGSCNASHHIILNMTSQFRLLTIGMPVNIFYKRLINPHSVPPGVLNTANGIGHILHSMLASVDRKLLQLNSRDFHAIDISLIEFFLSSLAENVNLKNFTNHAETQLFQRICDSIEAQITNADLNLHTVSCINQVSTRYIQKLFTSAGMKFNQYIRERRIELCKRDLANPHYANLSISEICYKWGFSDLAYFSRVFSQHVGISPRAYREMLKKNINTHISHV
ncbi:helix-turn-helix transcriptional regulator [Enterobacteriaceae bacterium YMB-R22]|jgi:AraC-like DNA-binding protein|uniref:helix-turn-helix transcriptional regulator n=1 Tax=Tenebrionicola larvae TaxID=2815733 RepID=UPI0020111BD6|nr:helix-turn-helix transcriptional regulator [Tenebrionicola larvae]MBV4411941.1 helix-turn-helix transcriptional regulator [Tenebrionicola larvae]